MRRVIRIGTRGSVLALTQTLGIQKRLQKKFPHARFESVVVKTMGDEFQSVEIFKKTHIGIFTKAIEKKLLTGKIDMAVHSLKDVPTYLPAGLCLAAFPKRLDPRDVLISRKRWNIRTLPKGARVGTASPRRKRQLSLLRPDLKLEDIRGNLDTRVKRVLMERKLDAIIVAKAGLLRLKKYLRHAAPLSPRQVLPAVGQAALAIETRKKDKSLNHLVRTLNDSKTEIAVLAERAFLQTLQGGCRVPVGIYSSVQKNKLKLRAAVFSVKSEGCLRSEISGQPKDFKSLGRKLAKSLLRKGAGRFLKEARETP